MSLNVDIIPILSDNYAYILSTSDGRAAVVDPGDAAPVLAFAKDHSLRIESVINTHHHWDHIDGNEEVIKATRSALYAPASETNRIAGVAHPLHEDEAVSILGHRFTVLNTPCHTRGHICLYSESEGILFTGDTLFSMGCGRFFEGTAQDMFAAFEKLRDLPDETLIYCGHEYTQSNGAFAAHVEPDNKAIAQRVAEVKALREAGHPTLPVSLGLEKTTNPFLRAKSAAELGELRALKDNF